MKIAACILSLVNALPNVEKLGQVTNPGQIDIDNELIMSGINPGHLLMRRLPPAMFNCKFFTVKCQLELSIDQNIFTMLERRCFITVMLVTSL